MYTNHQRVRGFSQATIRRRTWTLRQLEAARPLDEHTVDTLEALLLRWPCAATRNALLSDIRGFYRWAVRRGHLTVNPAAEIEATRLPARAATPMIATDVARVLAVANRDQRVAFMLGLYAGLRCSEIAALHSRDVDLDTGTGFEDEELDELLGAVNDDADGDGDGDAADEGGSHVSGHKRRMRGIGLTYRIMVDCKDEEHQAKLLDKFERDGLSCKPVIS
jgi:hypothetical protein